MFERAELKILTRRIKEPRKNLHVVMGPRQVGKTTMVSQVFNQIGIPGLFESADAVAASNTNWLQQIWETARVKMKSQSAKEFLLVVDEIQKISNWSEMVKKLWDEDSFNDIQLKVILLGSSRLLLQQGLTESLAGRFETIYLSHWTFDEMEKAFGWDANTYAWFGGYPGSANLIHDEERWKRYIRDSLIETSISKDILMLTRIDKPALLKNLFELGCLYSGQILSFTKMQGQLQDAGNTTTLSHYLNLLETAGLLGGLEKYSHTTIRKRSSSPKFQVHNNALLSAQDVKFLSDTLLNHVEWGRIVESAVGSHLVNQSLREYYSVYYWRDRNNEVDFILERQGKIIAIEVKSGYSKNKKGMDAFKNKFDPYKTYFIDNKGLSWNEFLKINPVELF
ncbi:MAG: ATP-binding protein [Bacteroidales bacterium]|nr:ATP-binding protein [Bacteroidales bacterium]